MIGMDRVSLVNEEVLIPAGIDPDPIENVREMDAEHLVRSQCTFRIIDDQNKQCPCTPNRSHCVTKQQRSRAN